MQKRTLKQITADLHVVAAMGWVKSRRTHDTGIGHTLEALLGLKENNIAMPDFGVMELKSQRSATSSMMTLFTKKPDGITNAEILAQFGYPDPEYPKLKILHQTIAGGRANARGFRLRIDQRAGRLLVMQNSKTLGYYDLDLLRDKATQKIGNGLILVFAEAKKEKGIEYFRYTAAWLLKGLIPENFLALSKYDIRLGVYRSGAMIGKPHDHGSAFRLAGLSEETFPTLFRTHKKIL